MGTKSARLLALGVVALISLLTIGLAVPGIIVHVQNIGVGSGSISGLVSTGTVCVPYEYYVEVYYYFPFIGWIYLGSTTVPNDNITQVYPGNFSADLVAETNVSAVVHYNEEVLSKGGSELTTTLPAGNYTAVNISPSINSTVALNGEFDVVLESPQYSLSSGGIRLAVQKLSLGLPTGSYTDVRVYLDTYYSGSYRLDVYADLRCYFLAFSPPPLAASAFSLDELFKVMRRKPLHRCRPCSDSLFELLQDSPYWDRIPDIAEEALEKLMPLIEEKVKELGLNSAAINTTNASIGNWTLVVPGNWSIENSTRRG